MDEFKIDGLDNLSKVMAGVANRFPEEKEKELLKLGYMFEGELKPNIPVDTGRLVASVNTQIVDSNTVETGTNVKYAQAVNDGFEMKQHFVSKEMLAQGGGKNWQKYNVSSTVESEVTSGSYVNDNIKLPITDERVKGMTVHAQFVPGKHFMEKSFQPFKTKAKLELETWTGNMLEAIAQNNEDLINTFKNL